MSSKKKIIWFVNIAFDEESLGEGLNKSGKGWLANLADLLLEQFDLHVVAVDPYKKGSKGKKLTTHYLRPSFWKLKLLTKAIWPIKDMEGDLLDQMIQIITEVKPDLIHVHGSEKQFIKIASHPKVKHIPVGLSIQGIILAISKSYTTAYPYSFLKRFYALRGFQKTNWLPQRLLARYGAMVRQSELEKKHYKHFDFFLGRTDWDKHIAQLLGNNAPYFKVDRILKPQFYDEVERKPIQKDNKLIIHTTLGNAIFKGIDVIAEALSYLLNKGIDLEWHIAGVSSSSWSVRAARKKLGHKFPKEGLVFLGQLNAKNLVDQMSKAHLYVMCSYIENSPNNLAEAMMLGLPCIATFAGGTASYLEHKKQGVLVPTGDALAVAAEVFELYKNPKKAIEYGKNARIAALERHNLNTIKQQIISAYGSILKI